MKRYAFIALFGCFSLFLASCITTSKEGALVKVLRPNTETPSMVCQGSGGTGIAYIYVGPETISGVRDSRGKARKLHPRTNARITQNARAVLNESKFINSIGISPESASEHPSLGVEVIELSVKASKSKNRISKEGVFEANFNISQPGGINCVAAKPILIEKHYEMPLYKGDRLPSDRVIESKMIQEAVRRALRQFVPVKRTVLRPVKEGSELSEKAAAMIDGSNCTGAFQLLKPTVGNPACSDAQALYNAGVAAECAAWSMGKDQKNQVAYLKVAEKYYAKAAMLLPGDKDVQKAKKEVTYELTAFYKAFLSQEELKYYMKSFETPTGY